MAEGENLRGLAPVLWVRDPRVIRMAGGQFNRVSRVQLEELGFSESALAHQLTSGSLVVVEDGVYAIPPVLEDPWGTWMGATLTAPGTVLSQESAACARGWLDFGRSLVTVTRPGSGGPRRHGGLLVFRSVCIERDAVNGVPITSTPMTLIDLAGHAGDRAFARAVRNALRLGDTTLFEMGDWMGSNPRRRAIRRLGRALASHSGLPIERARSGAEIRAMQLIRDAKMELPRLNVKVAGEEADLSWPRYRVIVEIDGGPYHQDVGEDARKEAAWTSAGWDVRRLPSDDVYEQPRLLLALVPSNVPQLSP
jgi:very-short-patch-repair endonuclease